MTTQQSIKKEPTKQEYLAKFEELKSKASKGDVIDMKKYLKAFRDHSYEMRGFRDKERKESCKQALKKHEKYLFEKLITYVEKNPNETYIYRNPFLKELSKEVIKDIEECKNSDLDDILFNECGYITAYGDDK